MEHFFTWYYGGNALFKWWATSLLAEDGPWAKSIGVEVIVWMAIAVITFILVDQAHDSITDWRDGAAYALLFAIGGGWLWPAIAVFLYYVTLPVMMLVGTLYGACCISDGIKMVRRSTTARRERLQANRAEKERLLEEEMALAEPEIQKLLGEIT